MRGHGGLHWRCHRDVRAEGGTEQPLQGPAQGVRALLADGLLHRAGPPRDGGPYVRGSGQGARVQHHEGAVRGRADASPERQDPPHPAAQPVGQ